MAKKKYTEENTGFELPAEVAKGNYVNMAVVSHSKSEFVMDFLSLMPGMPAPTVLDRIITTPETAKQILLTLQENVEKYERNFGEIELDNQTTDIPIGFGSPNAKA